MNAAQTLIDQLMDNAAVSDVVISATGDKVATTGRFTRCSASETLDIEKTVRRMLAASSTIGATLSQVTLHFGAQLLLAIPISAEVNVLDGHPLQRRIPHAHRQPANASPNLSQGREPIFSPT